MVEGSTTEYFIKRMKELSTQHSSVGEVVPDTHIVQIMLGVLPKSYESMILLSKPSCVRMNSRTSNARLCGKLKLKEAQSNEDSFQLEALSITRARKQFGTFCKGARPPSTVPKEFPRGGPMLNVNHMRAPDFPRGPRRGNCNLCGEWGHYTRECSHRHHNRLN